MASYSTDAWNAQCFSLSVTCILINVILSHYQKIPEQQPILELLNFIEETIRMALEDALDAWISILSDNLTHVAPTYHSICKLYQISKLLSRFLFLLIWSKSEL